ncbi:FecR family protein [Persicitalea sp.]|uniref:FecR family protein n=1 Tax=Persicitalea sp. TaxID=3100273 RepID=UPI00359466CD
MNSMITKELLFSHFTGKTSAMQKQSIDEWALIKANEELYYKWLEEYEAKHPEYPADIDKAISNYRHFLEQNRKNAFAEKPGDIIDPVKKGRRWLLAVGVAASLSIILLVFGMRNTELWKYRTLRTGYGKTRTVQLSDGSRVILNANSSLRIPRWGFGKTSRNVLLAGEASFSVKHIATNQKFVVQTAKEFEVEVLGTEFTVFARDRGTRVVLNKGKVQINLREGRSTRKMVMKPGDLVTLDKNSHIEKKSIPKPEILSAWQSHRYEFDKTALQEIVYLLQENYGLEVEVEDKGLLSQTVSGSLTVDNADHILELIETVLGLKITKDGHKVHISQNKQ